MAHVFDYKETVFFVGGRGDGHDGVDKPGGCTKFWWNTEVAANDKAMAMAKLMGVNSAPIANVSSLTIVEAVNRMTGNPGDFDDCEVGMIAWLGGLHFSNGLYEIEAIAPDTSWIECEGFNPSDDSNTGEATVGGAFDDLDTALSEVDANVFNVDMHVNLDDDEAIIEVDAGGSSTRNTFLRILGYHLIPGDMSIGGEFYESPNEILRNGAIHADKAVELDGDAEDESVFEINDDNVIFENLHVYNTGTANLITFTGTPQNIVLRNCRFSSGDFVYRTIATSVLVDSCYSHSDLTGNHYQMSGNANVILNCVGNVAADKIFAVVATVEGSQVVGCLAVNGARGIRVFGYEVTAVNNTFYNQTSYGIDITGGLRAIAYNNIFDLYPAAIAFSITTAGTMLYNDYNCFIESDGTPLTVGSHGSGYEVPVKGKHSVEVDPDFVDAANGDFRARNPVLLRGGRPGPDGRAAVIGAIGQEYQFAERARVMNPGRAGIVR